MKFPPVSFGTLAERAQNLETGRVAASALRDCSTSLMCKSP
jgi:hypothetical protein